MKLSDLRELCKRMAKINESVEGNQVFLVLEDDEVEAVLHALPLLVEVAETAAALRRVNYKPDCERAALRAALKKLEEL